MKVEVTGSKDILQGCARAALLLVLSVLLVLLSAMGLYYFEQRDDRERAECVAHGGQVVIVHGSRPVDGEPWACVGATW